MSDTTVKDYYDAYWERDEITPLNDPLTETRVRLLLEILRDAHARSVIDAGCGAGGVVGALRAEGFDATGMEIAGKAVALARAAHPDATFVEHSIEDVPWPLAPESVDAVVSFEVIEHLLRPRRLVAGAHGVLRPGGRLVLTTPYHGRLKNVALSLVAFDRHFAAEGDHIRFFTDAALARLLETEGFAVERVEHFGRVPGLWKGVLVSARKR